MTCFLLLDIKLKVLLGDFPGGPVVKNLPANAGDMGLIPGPRRPHMSYGNEAHVPQLLKLHVEPMLPSKRSHHSEKPTHHNQSVAPTCHDYRKLVHNSKNSGQQKPKTNQQTKVPPKYYLSVKSEQ